MVYNHSMDSIKAFYNYLQRFTDLTEDEFNRNLLPICKVRRFGKKEIITKAGEIENYFNFIVKGQMLLSQESFHSRQPSDYFIETIEPTTVVSISYDDAEKMFASSQRMEHLGRLIVTYSMVIKDRWQIQLVKMTPRERFLNFVTKNPELMQRVPQKFLASYLNIKPETFSRFKHLIRTHKTSAN